MDDVGSRLREERQRLGLTQTALGSRGAVGKTTQIHYESGASFPDAAYLAAVAKIGVDVQYVITGQRTPRVVEGLSGREVALLNNFRSLSEESRAAVQRLCDAMAQSIGTRASG